MILHCDNCSNLFETDAYAPICPACVQRKREIIAGPIEQILKADDDGETSLSIPFDSIPACSEASGLLLEKGVHNALELPAEGGFALLCEWEAGLERIRGEAR
jgi:hypothetical protein